ncbi:MAG: M28 family metallopeptidase [Planctomycetia bacterium]
MASGFSRWAGLVLVLGALAGLCGALRAEPVRASGPGGEAGLRRHVERLCAPEMAGRGGWEQRERAAAYVAGELAALGLQPLPGQASMAVDFGSAGAQQGEPPAPRAARPPRGRNVCAWWPAPPPAGEPLPEYVLLSAHYDHLGVRDGVTYPGADDNASGVAVMLEVVRALVEREQRVARSAPLPRALCVVAFDLEEQRLEGSRAFVAQPPVPLERCALFLTLDQMGRSLADLVPGTLFLMGSEHCAWLDGWLAGAEVPEGASLARLGIDFQPPTGYSDYLPFQEREVPFLFVTTGACAHYHRPEDTPERLDWASMARHATFVRGLVTAALEVSERPAWRAGAEPRLEEVAVVRRIAGAAGPRLDELKVEGPVRFALAGFVKYLDGLLAKGSVTAAERANVSATARMLFTQAVALRGRAPAAPPAPAGGPGR